MRNVRLEIAYDGSRFFGWQRQAGFESAQEAIEEALSALVKSPVIVHGAGRTDTGVHALRQVASVHLETGITDDRLRHALNAYMDESIRVLRAETCPGEFHARFSSRGKRYAYLTQTARFRPPWGETQAHWVTACLDFEIMRRAAQELVGTHDFRAFGNAGSPRSSTVRTVRRIHWIRHRSWFVLVVEGDGFLYNMVRTIAGTLIDMGRGRLDTQTMQRALATGVRRELGLTAPAGGLYLMRVLYPERIFCGPDKALHRTPGMFP